MICNDDCYHCDKDEFCYLTIRTKNDDTFNKIQELLINELY